MGFVGCGAIAEWHWNAIRAGAVRSHVTACIDPSAERAGAFAAKTGGTSFPSLADAVSTRAVDAVAILVPHHLHEPLAVEAFEAGLHVLLEKPMATSLEACERILAAARAAGTVFMLAENAQYWPGVVRAKELLDQGAIGELVTARSWSCTPPGGRFFEGAVPWRLRAATAGGGVAIDAGSHFLRPLRMWCGELVRVIAVTAKQDPTMEVESLCRALCSFQSGVVASFDALLAPVSGARVPRFQVTGTKGEIVIDGREVRLYDGTPGDGTVMGPSDYLASYEAEWRNFESAVLDGTPLAASAEFGLGELRGALAMYRSAASGGWEAV